VLSGFDLAVRPGEKIAFVGRGHLAKTALFRILANEDTPDAGNFLWGQTISWSYFPKESARLFESDVPLVSWLAQYSPTDDETFVRSFLGRMLFSGDEGLKPVRVLSGGERVRCLLARLMLSGANCLVLDEPTYHLDLEAIEALDEGPVDFPGGVIDRAMSFDEHLQDRTITELRDSYYHGHVTAEI
jgi:ATPase subunit of ABC transporter with duplicated ATPase domains